MLEASEGHITHAIVNVGGTAVLRSSVVCPKLTLSPETPEYGAGLQPTPAGDSHIPKRHASNVNLKWGALVVVGRVASRDQTIPMTKIVHGRPKL
jgi:hypothetical protein